MAGATQKDGASNSARPAVETASAATDGGGSRSPAVSRLRALAEAMGAPCIVRDTDGNGYLLTVERLQVINIHPSTYTSQVQ